MGPKCTQMFASTQTQLREVQDKGIQCVLSESNKSKEMASPVISPGQKARMKTRNQILRRIAS